MDRADCLSEVAFFAPWRLCVSSGANAFPQLKELEHFTQRRKDAKLNRKKRMTRRRFYAPPDAFAPDRKSVTLSADEVRHGRDVLRLRPGDEVYVFDGEGKEFRCALREYNRDSAALDVVEEVEPAHPESPLDLTLAISLLKHDKFDLVIQKSTELGVTRILPIESQRADVKLRDAEDERKRLIRWQRIALEAAKQSGRARVPEISAPLTFESLVEQAATNETIGLMFSERDGDSLSPTVKDLHARRVVAVVGPEGGWLDEEIELARENGWLIVTLGGRTLRAETAAIAVIALLQHRFGDLD